MKNHRWILHVVTQAQTVPAEVTPGAPRNDPLVRTARGMLILALLLGSLGADAAASSAVGSVGHANGHQPAGTISLAASASAISSVRISNMPWMY